MSAMRIYNRVDFEEALNRNGFTKTNTRTFENTLWYHKETDKHYPITDADYVPDFILDKYLNTVNSLYKTPKDTISTGKSFAVTRKSRPLEVVK